MIFADKLISLRKKNGWSQEDLSEKLDVSRQSVSKWESAQSVPDLDKIIKISQIFGVSTDYLLKDELGEESIEYVDSHEPGDVKSVSVELANEYMKYMVKSGIRIGIGVVLCVLSPVILIFLAGLSSKEGSFISENAAAGLGIVALLVQILIAVTIFIFDDSKKKRFQFIEKEPFKLEYGVHGIVEEKKNRREGIHTLTTAIGVGLCILSVVPLITCAVMEMQDMVLIMCTCLLFMFISAGTFLFIRFGSEYTSYTQLLQEEEYTVESKRNYKTKETISGAYWCLVTAGYLAWSFISMRWELTWIVWPVAGVLFGFVSALVNIFHKNVD